MDAERAAAALGKNSEIAAGLCRFHDAEGLLLPRDMQSLGIIASDLEKNAAVRATFVSWPSGMQKAGAEAENGGHFFLVAQGVTNCLQRFFMRGIHGDVAEDAKIIARLESRKMALQNISKSRAVHCSYILFVGEEFDSACFKKRHLWRQAPGGFVLAPQPVCFHLVRLPLQLGESNCCHDTTPHT